METTSIPDCSETIVCTALAETWMSLEYVKNLGTAEKLDIYIFYHYNLLIVRLNNASSRGLPFLAHLIN